MGYRIRRIIIVTIALVGVGLWLVLSPGSYEQEIVQESPAPAPLESLEQEQTQPTENPTGESAANLASAVLEKLEIKGRAPKAGYNRSEEFYKNWPSINGCSLRQIIIKREFGESAQLAENGCDVISGTFTEPYTGNKITLYQKSDFSHKIQIDHVVALSDAWQKGAQYKSKEERYAMATDPLNLIAVDSVANKQKSDGDAATWLPPNKAFRCQYVARQVSVKFKYSLWVTQAEHDAIANVLKNCPNEPAVGI